MFAPGDANGDGSDQPTEMSSNPFRNAGSWSNEDGEGDYKNEYQSTSFVGNDYDGRYQQTDGFRCVAEIYVTLMQFLTFKSLLQAGQHRLGGQLVCVRG